MFTTLPPDTVLMVALLAVFLFLLLPFILNKRRHGSGVDKFDLLYKKISEDIKYSVTPKFIELSQEANDLIELAIEIWRMEQRIMKSSSELPENHLKGLENSIQKLKRYIDRHDIEIVDYKNVKYNEGLNLEVLSIEKDPSLPESIIKETIEPTIMHKGQVVRKAKVILIKNN